MKKLSTDSISHVRKKAREKGGSGRVKASGEGALPKGAIKMKIERYEQLGKAETQQAYLLQRTNDLLEQIERLKAIDTTENPELVIAVSQELRSVYETLDRQF